MTEVQVENGLDQAMLGYRKYLEKAPESSLTPEAMRRLADLKLEKEYGILGDGEILELPAPEPSAVTADAGPRGGRPPAGRGHRRPLGVRSGLRTARGQRRPGSRRRARASRSSSRASGSWQSAGPLEAIELYDQILETYPTYPTTIRSSTRNRARSTSWDGPKKPLP